MCVFWVKWMGVVNQKVACMHVRRYGYGEEWVSECGWVWVGVGVWMCVGECEWVWVGVRVEEILLKLTTNL